MKRIVFTLLTAILMLANVNTSKASHVLGGEISWECLSSGRYVFYMSVYINCASNAASWNYTATSLNVSGSPLPRNQANSFISSIPMQPDSNKWQNNRNGDASPQCDENNPNQISCGAQGTTRIYYYKSSAMVLKGVPPANGWTFIYQPPCCRPNVENLVSPTSNTMNLRAKMYPTANNTNANPCIDSSPEFRALPVSMICRGYTFTYNHTAIDKDLDSIVYAWDRTYNTYPNQPAAYRTPQYNFNNPTPGPAANANNIAATLDPITGVIRLAVYSGIGAQSFLTVVRADAYRDGVRIASVFREIPFIFFDCPPLPTGPGGLGGTPNNPPDIFIDGVPAEDTVANIVAGQTVRIPFQATDYDYAGQNGTGLQTVTVVPDGFMFSKTLTDPTNCEINGIAPCAYLQSQSPTLNTNVDPPRREIADLGGVATEFVWDTKCYHIRTAGTGIPGQQFGIYSFVMRTFDNHCPIPGINYPTITVRVRDPLPMTEPIMKGASVGLDGRLTYSWAPPIDSAFTFNRYASEFSSPNNGNAPGFWQNLRPNVTNYQQERYEPGFQFFAGGAQPNILQKVPGKDWYFRMSTESGCSGNVASQPSEPVQVIEVDATPVGQAPDPARSKVRLDWNRPKPMFSNTYPYYIYESPTHFYVWENDSIDIGGQYIGGEAVASNWYLRGDTSATTYELNTNTCNARVGFRIEARDTVIIWEQGSAMKPGDEKDTLTFSTFSIIDTTYMVSDGFIPAPQLDTIMVKANGDVYFRVDRANAGTAGRFRYYESSTNNTSFADVKADNDSLNYTGFNGNNAVGNFVIESQDKCNPNILAESGVYSTILPTGELLQPTCSLNYELRWNVPTGFTSPIRRFEIYVDSANTGFRLEKTVNNATATSTTFKVNKGVVYRFRVIAVDEKQSVNMSAIVNYTSPTNLRSFEIVPAPKLLCSYVEDNGNVKLTFKSPRDTTGNGIEYRFDYRQRGAGNWLTFNGSQNVTYGQDNEVTITGIDAIANEYEFRSFTISGCDGVTPSNPSAVLRSIKLTAMADPSDKDKSVVLNWNQNGATSNGDYAIYRTENLGGNSPYFSADSVANTDQVGYIDYSNGDICDNVNGYYTQVPYLDTNDNVVCYSRSAYDTALVKDRHKPDYQLIDFVTVNPQTEELEVYWSEKLDEDIDSLEFLSSNGPIDNNSWTVLGKVSWYENPQRFVIPINQLDARDTSFIITVRAHDGCGNTDEGIAFDYDYHRNMDVDVEWNQCDSTLEVNWTGYYYFNEGEDEVTYTVYVDSTAGGGTFREIGSSETTDSSYSHKVYAGDMNYRFYVKAVNSDGSLAANSNIDSDSAFYQDEPLYGYAHYATVTPNKAVELQMLKDTTIRQGGYSIFRGLEKDIRSMKSVGRVSGDDVFDESTFKYTDLSAETDERPYFYKIITENQCGGNVDTSNFASSIHLSVYADNEAVTNNLRWNQYTDWDSTVAYYNIYRGFNGGEPDDLIAVVAPDESSAYNTYVDDVYDNSNVKGRYCYKVEAVQGPINSEFNGLIGSATSVSNEGCTTQKPLFYVPNAFAPDGVNKVFLPKGQFFDFSLYEMAIYNRWGEQIFITRDVNEGWDGTQNGELVPLGSYVYTIRFKDADGKEHKRKGTVTVIR